MSIASEIAERLKDVGPLTRSRVIEHFANKEADKRADAMIAGLDKLDGLERDLRKAKADAVTYSEAGEVVSEAWTKDALEKRKKLIEQIEKLRRAIDKADDKGDFGDLYGLVK